MAYRIKYYKQAIEDAKRLQREDPKAFKKLLKLESELNATACGKRMKGGCPSLGSVPFAVFKCKVTKDF